MMPQRTSAELHSLILAELEEGEPLLFFAVPDAALLRRETLKSSTTVLMFAAFSCLAGAYLWSSLLVKLITGQPVGLSNYGLPLLVTIFMAVLPKFMGPTIRILRNLRNTGYAITDRRVMVLTGGAKAGAAPSCDSLSPEHFDEIFVRNNGGGRGSVYWQNRSDGEPTVVYGEGFVGIEEYERAAQLLRVLRANAESPTAQASAD